MYLTFDDIRLLNDGYKGVAERQAQLVEEAKERYDVAVFRRLVTMDKDLAPYESLATELVGGISGDAIVVPVSNCKLEFHGDGWVVFHHPKGKSELLVAFDDPKVECDGFLRECDRNGKRKLFDPIIINWAAWRNDFDTKFKDACFEYLKEKTNEVEAKCAAEIARYTI